MDMALPLLAALLIPFALWLGLHRWRALIFVTMILMVFEGALRKWFFPGVQAYIYFIKDGLILLALLGFMVSRRPTDRHHALITPLTVIMAASTLYFFIHIAHPNIPDILIGIIGFKNYLLYAALAYMVPYCFESEEDIERKFLFYMVLMIPVCALGLLQFTLPPDHFLNVYVQHDNVEMNISTFGSSEGEVRTRTSSTFSYIGGYATFIIAMYLVAFSFAVGSKPGSRIAIVAYSLLALAVMATFTTGSRAVLFMTQIATVPLLFLMVSVRVLSVLIAMRIAFIAAVIIGLTTLFSSDAVDAFVTRATTSDSAFDRVLSPFTETIEALEASPFFGVGIGTTHASAGTIVGTGRYTNAWWLQGLLFEAELARVTLEVGLPGFFLVTSSRIILFIISIIVTFRLRTHLFKAIASVICIYLGLQLAQNIINNPTGGLYYWFGAGLLLALYRLDNQHMLRHGEIKQSARFSPRPLRNVAQVRSAIQQHR